MSKRVIVHDPEVIEAPVLPRAEIPVHLLQPCTVLDLPEFGIKWSDTIEIIKIKDLQQHACNVRLGIISQWQDDQRR